MAVNSRGSPHIDAFPCSDPVGPGPERPGDLREERRGGADNTPVTNPVTNGVGCGRSTVDKNGDRAEVMRDTGTRSVRAGHFEATLSQDTRRRSYAYPGSKPKRRLTADNAVSGRFAGDKRATRHPLDIDRPPRRDERPGA